MADCCNYDRDDLESSLRYLADEYGIAFVI